MNNLENKIKSLLSTKEELDRKQIAFFLPQKKIEQLDYFVKELSKYSNGKVNRNALIELAVDNILEVSPDILKAYEKDFKEEKNVIDTIVCPSQDGGQAFLKNYNCWQYVKVDTDRIKDLKYLCLYVGYPHSRLMYWAKIKDFKEDLVDGKKKYIINIEKPLNQIDIPLGDANPFIMRSPKYTSLEKIKNAKTLEDIF